MDEIQNGLIQAARNQIQSEIKSANQMLDYWKKRKDYDVQEKKEKPHSFVMSELAIPFYEVALKYYTWCEEHFDENDLIWVYFEDRHRLLNGIYSTFGNLSEEIRDPAVYGKVIPLLEEIMNTWFKKVEKFKRPESSDAAYVAVEVAAKGLEANNKFED